MGRCRFGHTLEHLGAKVAYACVCFGGFFKNTQKGTPDVVAVHRKLVHLGRGHIAHVPNVKAARRVPRDVRGTQRRRAMTPLPVVDDLVVGLFIVVLFFVFGTCPLQALHGRHPAYPFGDDAFGRMGQLGAHKTVRLNTTHAHANRLAVGLATVQHDVHGIFMAAVSGRANMLKRGHLL